MLRSDDIPPTLVILPGLDGTDVFFRPFLASLPATIRCLVIEYPQRGAHGYASLLCFARRAIAGIDNVYVLGSSFSGPLAIMLAAAEPDKVRGLILSATFVRSPTPRLKRWKFAAVGPVIWLVRVVRRIPVWTRLDRNDPFRRAKAETWARVSARSLAARLRAIVDVDVRQALREISRPILVISFAADAVIARCNSVEILACSADKRWVELPGSHFGMYTGPHAYAAAIADFMLGSPGICISSSQAFASAA